MNDESFAELLASIREGGQILRGETGPSRLFAVDEASGLSVVVEENDVGYLASVPGIQGAFAEGDTVEQAILNCMDVLAVIADYRAERGESL